jgi:hypothetical protein
MVPKANRFKFHEEAWFLLANGSKYSGETWFLGTNESKFVKETCVWASFVVRKHVLLGNLGPFAKRKLQFPYRKVEENLVNSPLQ